MRKIKLTRLHIITFILSLLWITMGTIEVLSGYNWLFASDSAILCFISDLTFWSNFIFAIIRWSEADPSGILILIIIGIQLLTVGLHWVIFYYVAKIFIHIKNKIVRKNGKE